MDFPIDIAVPAGTTCSGTVAGQQNVCFMKIANCKIRPPLRSTNDTDCLIANGAGPFGGVIAFQMAGAGNTTAASPAAAAAAGGAAGATKAGKAAKGTTARSFVA